MKSLFDSIDQDHTGKIKWTEFIASCVQEKTFLEEDRIYDAFNKLDVDHTGFISKDNLKQILGSDVDDAAVERIIQEADFAQDGVIDLDEFRRMMKGEIVGSAD